MIRSIPNAGDLHAALEAARGLVTFHRRNAADTILEMQGADEIAASHLRLMRMGADYHNQQADKIAADITGAESLAKLGRMQQAFQFLKGKRYA